MSPLHARSDTAGRAFLRKEKQTLWLLALLLCFAGVASSSSIITGIPQRGITANTRRILDGLRGGSSPDPHAPRSTLYVLNPDYQDARPVTLGDLENQTAAAASPPKSASLAFDTSQSSWGPNNFLPPILQYLNRLKIESPSIYFALLSSTLTFVAWQIPPFQALLGQHFVCSRRNLKAGRYGTLLLSCLSHAGPIHLVFNMIALLSFGPQVNRVLSSSSWSLEAFLIGAGLVGSLFYLLLDQHQGGCMGLSGVTLSLLSFSSRIHPKQTLRFFLGPIPVRMTAEQSLMVLVAWSVLGTLVPNRSGVAHAAHLGGLVFGYCYYDLWIRRRQLGRLLFRGNSI